MGIIEIQVSKQACGCKGYESYLDGCNGEDVVQTIILLAGVLAKDVGAPSAADVLLDLSFRDEAQ